MVLLGLRGISLLFTHWSFTCDYCGKNLLYFFRAEQTYEYTPPEALLNATWYQGPTSSTLKYVIFLHEVSIHILFFSFKMLLGLLILHVFDATFMLSQIWHVERWCCDVRVGLRDTRCFSDKCFNTDSIRSTSRRLEWGREGAGI